MRPLWERALRRRAAEKRAARAKGRGRPRKFPRAQVGDRFGDQVVIALQVPDASCNETVLVRCKCGHEKAAYVFNLRRSKTCRSCAARARQEARQAIRTATGSTRAISRLHGVSQSVVSRTRRCA